MSLFRLLLFFSLFFLPFSSVYIVYTLIVGLANATNAERDESIRKKIRTAQYMTVISWLTYPIVYIIPMLGVSGADAIVGIQLGYCLSDIISKCGVGFLIYGITNAKSKAIRGGGEAGLLNNNMWKGELATEMIPLEVDAEVEVEVEVEAEWFVSPHNSQKSQLVISAFERHNYKK